MPLENLIPLKVKNWINNNNKNKANKLSIQKKYEKAHKKIDFFPDDVWLVSYPKSGNTWLRFLIGNYLTGNQFDFTNFELVIPDIQVASKDILQKIQRPRFIKSHFPFVPEYKNVVYLVRDGRDVAVSYYFHLMKFGKISKKMSFKDYLAQFNDGSIDRRSTPWYNHVNSWLDNSPDNFYLVKYEELKKNTLEKLIGILNFANLSIDEKKLISAIQASEFSRMKYLDKTQHNKNINKIILNSDPNIPFVRSGKIGEYNKFFDDYSMKEFMKVHGSALKRLGY